MHNKLQGDLEKKFWKFLVFILSLIILGVVGFLIYTLVPMDKKISDLVFSLSQLFLINGVIIAIFRYFLQRETIKEINSYVDNGLRNGIELLRVCNIIGLEYIFRNQKEAGFSELIENCSTGSDIFILQTWIPAMRELKPAFETALKKGANVEILLLDENSGFLAKRCEDLESSRHEYKACVDDLESLVQKSENTRGKFSYKVYDCLPYFPIYIIGDNMYVGIYFKEGALLSPFF